MTNTSTRPGMKHAGNNGQAVRPALSVVPGAESLSRREGNSPMPLGSSNTNLPAELARWVSQMRAEGLADRTIEERPLVVLRAAAATGASALTLTEQGIIEWLGALPSPGTKATYFGALCAWSNWLVRTGLRDDDPTDRLKTPRVPRRIPRPISNKALEQVLATRMRRRTRVMVHLASYQGLRVHEVAKMHGHDFDIASGLMRVVGKGGAEIWLPLHPIVRADAEQMPTHDWWFPSVRNPRRPIRRDTVSTTVGDVMRRAGVKGTAHQLRHWYATELLRSGTDIRVVQTLMRHASLATTALYTAVDGDQQLEAQLRLPVIRERRAA